MVMDLFVHLLHHGPRQDCTLVGPQGGSQDVKHNNIGQAGIEQIKPTFLVHPMPDVPRVAHPNIPPPHTTSGVPCLALSPTVVGEAGTGARLHLSLKNIDSLRPSNIISAIKIAFRTHASFSDNVPHPSSHVGVEVRPAGNVVHPKPAIKTACLVARKPKSITWANPVSVSTPEPVWSGQFEDRLDTCDVTSVGTGTCHTYNLFQRKEIQFGFFKIFKFLVALLSVSCLNDSPWVYHVKSDTPKEIIETILGDVHSKQLLALDQGGDCRKRSLNCSACKFRNSQSSLVDMKELKLLSEHMCGSP